MAIPKSYSFKYEVTESNDVKCQIVVGIFEINYEMINGSALMLAMKSLANPCGLSKKEITDQFRKGCRIDVKIIELEVDLKDDWFTALAAIISNGLAGVNAMGLALANETVKMIETWDADFRKKFS